MFQVSLSNGLDAVWIQSTLEVLGCNAKLRTQGTSQAQDHLGSQIEKLPDTEVLEEFLLTNTVGDLELISGEPKRAILYGPVQREWVKFQIAGYCLCQPSISM